MEFTIVIYYYYNAVYCDTLLILPVPRLFFCGLPTLSTVSVFTFPYLFCEVIFPEGLILLPSLLPCKVAALSCWCMVMHQWMGLNFSFTPPDSFAVSLAWSFAGSTSQIIAQGAVSTIPLVGELFTKRPVYLLSFPPVPHCLQDRVLPTLVGKLSTVSGLRCQA